MVPTTRSTQGAAAKSGLRRTTRYTPAVTMVAAWMRAETGVGPAMASGSQVNSGIWADLPQAPPKSRIAARPRSGPRSWSAKTARLIWARSRVAKRWIRMKVPTRKQASPMRLTTKAFCPASAGQPPSFWYQKPISR